QNTRYGVLCIMQRNVCNEAETPMVNSHHGDVIEGKLARCAQHGAVPAHDDGQIRLRPDARIIDYPEFIDTGVFCRFLFYQYLAPDSSDVRGQFSQRRVEAAVLITANECDGLEMHNEVKPV